MATSPQIELIPADQLRLDPLNPRLPEDSRKWKQHEILVHLKTTGALEELAHSMASEGFFPNEPLTVMKSEKPKGFIALEGNRRVATLMMLLGQPEAGDEEFFDLELTSAQRKRLATIPCLVVDEREAVDSFIGFRHIGGLKTWSPEAKARWIVHEVDKEAKSGGDNPFLTVGRRVGQYGPTIRASYLSLQVLRFARDAGGVKIDRLVDPKAQRFGVWLRCLSSPEIKAHMHLDLTGGEGYREVLKAVKRVSAERVGDIVSDLVPEDDRPAILRDSRDVTVYGRVLANDRARKLLRSRRDLDIARQVIEDVELAAKLRKEAGRLDVLRNELARVEMTPDLAEAVADVYAIARQMNSLAKSERTER